MQEDIERQEAPAATMAREEDEEAVREEETPGWDSSGSTDMLAYAIPVKVGITIIVCFVGMCQSPRLLSIPAHTTPNTSNPIL